MAMKQGNILLLGVGLYKKNVGFIDDTPSQTFVLSTQSARTYLRPCARSAQSGFMTKDGLMEFYQQRVDSAVLALTHRFAPRFS